MINLPPPREDTVTVLIHTWQQSPEWAQMADKTRREWLRYCRIVDAAWGRQPVIAIEPRHVLALRDTLATKPATANNLIRCLSSMLAWSVPRGWRAENPCREVRPLKGGDAYAPWPWDVIEAVKSDVRPDLWHAVALALYTGQRQGDVIAMRWDALTPNGIAVRQAKTGKQLLLPIHRELRAELDAIPRRAVTILTTKGGRPWTVDGFRTTWGKARPDILAERGLVFHGLRKSAVVMLLEAGCTDAEVAAITGQSREMVEHYARMVNQQQLARSAVLKWEASR